MCMCASICMSVSACVFVHLSMGMLNQNVFAYCIVVCLCVCVCLSVCERVCVCFDMFA